MCFIFFLENNHDFVKIVKLFSKAASLNGFLSSPLVGIPLAPHTPLMFGVLAMLPLTLIVILCLHSLSPYFSIWSRKAAVVPLSLHIPVYLIANAANPNSIKWNLAKQPRDEELWRWLGVPRKSIWSISQAVYYNIGAWMQGSCGHLQASEKLLIRFIAASHTNYWISFPT